jgi:hypothetical protein
MTSIRIAVISALAVAAVLGGRAEFVHSAPAPVAAHVVAGGTAISNANGCCKDPD